MGRKLPRNAKSARRPRCANDEIMRVLEKPIDTESDFSSTAQQDTSIQCEPSSSSDSSSYSSDC